MSDNLGKIAVRISLEKDIFAYGNQAQWYG